MRRTIITLVILIAVVSSALVDTVVAQESTNFTTTTAPSTTSEATQTIELSPTTRIKSWLFSNGTFSLAVKADIPTRIAITNTDELSRIPSEGDDAAVGKARIRRMTLALGTIVVKFRAESVGDASAIIVSSSNVDSIITIRSDVIKTGNPPAEYRTIQTLLASTTVVAAGGIFLWVRKERSEKQLEVEREWWTTG